MRFIFFVLLLMALIVMVSLPGQAQDDPAPPLRNTNRTAPERAPTILAQTEQSDGVNTVIAIPASADVYIASALAGLMIILAAMRYF